MKMKTRIVYSTIKKEFFLEILHEKKIIIRRLITNDEAFEYMIHNDLLWKASLFFPERMIKMNIENKNK